MKMLVFQNNKNWRSISELSGWFQSIIIDIDEIAQTSGFSEQYLFGIAYQGYL